MINNPAVGKDTEAFRRLHDATHEVGPTEAEFKRPIAKGVRYAIIVGAQNATPIVKEWWAVLNTIAACYGAELFVVPLRYKNPTSIWSASQQNAEHWAAEVRPYLWNQRWALNSNLMLIGDVKIPPTKSSPLSGFDAMSTTSSAIYAHPKLHMLTVPTPSNKMAKLLTTTGVCTRENYTDSGLGKISQFHHSLSAILIELDGPRFYLRQLHFDKKTKSCTDLDMRYYGDKFDKAPRALSLTMGDMHIRYNDPTVEKARERLLAQVRPHHRIWHDTLDSDSCSPHTIDDPFIEQGKQAAGRDSVRGEVQEALDYIAAHTDSDIQDIFVPSNHDDMLSRWIKRANWKAMSDDNGTFYLETALQMKLGSKMTKQGVEYPDPFTYWLRKAKIPNTTVLDQDQSFMLADVELSMHGNIGPNGARGSIVNLRRIGVKSVIGHSHRPGINEGCCQTGTSTYLRLGYNKGPSGWLNADVLLNADGKRQTIIYIDGRYRRK